MSVKYIINPITNRNIKVGSRTYLNLIHSGIIKAPKNQTVEKTNEDADDRIEVWNIEDDEEEPDMVDNEESEKIGINEEDVHDQYDDLDENDLAKIQEYVNNLRLEKQQKNKITT